MDRALGKIKKRGSQWCVVSEDGSKNFGCFDSKEAAQKRLGQVEFFKKSKSEEVTMVDGIKNPTESQIGGESHVASITERRKVPQVGLPSLDGKDPKAFVAEVFEKGSATLQAVMATDVSERLAQRIEELKGAKKLADRLLKKGMSGDEFKLLIGYLQEEIVADLAHQQVKAAHKATYRGRVMEQVAKNRRGE